MTGTGILYLKEFVPQISSVFTTHATVLGRALAGNNRPLYGNLGEFNPVQVAREFNTVSKHSLEKTSALAADAFTTVSEITSQECVQFFGKEVDVVTPNGFEDTFVPEDENFDGKRIFARKKILEDLQSFEIIHKKNQGINVIIKFDDDEVKQRIIDYCKENNLEFTECPRYIRIKEPAISIEVKRL